VTALKDPPPPVVVRLRLNREHANAAGRRLWVLHGDLVVDLLDLLPLVALGRDNRVLGGDFLCDEIVPWPVAVSKGAVQVLVYIPSEAVADIPDDLDVVDAHAADD
jgi:hypothetical protein